MVVVVVVVVVIVRKAFSRECREEGFKDFSG